MEAQRTIKLTINKEDVENIIIQNLVDNKSIHTDFDKYKMAFDGLENADGTYDLTDVTIELTYPSQRL